MKITHNDRPGQASKMTSGCSTRTRRSKTRSRRFTPIPVSAFSCIYVFMYLYTWRGGKGREGGVVCMYVYTYTSTTTISPPNRPANRDLGPLVLPPQPRALAARLAHRLALRAPPGHELGAVCHLGRHPPRGQNIGYASVASVCVPRPFASLGGGVASE